MEETKGEAQSAKGKNSQVVIARLHPPDEEPRWPSAIALLALGGLYAVLPSALLVGGHRWLLLTVISLLLVPTIAAHYVGNHIVNEVLGMILNLVVTIALCLVSGTANRSVTRT